MILSAEDGKLFYELWMPLLQYANKRTKMFPDNHSESKGRKNCN